MLLKKPHAFYPRVSSAGKLLLVLEYEVELEEKDMIPMAKDLRQAVSAISSLRAEKKDLEGRIQGLVQQISSFESQIADMQVRLDQATASQVSEADKAIETDNEQAFVELQQTLAGVQDVVESSATALPEESAAPVDSGQGSSASASNQHPEPVPGTPSDSVPVPASVSTVSSGDQGPHTLVLK